MAEARTDHRRNYTVLELFAAGMRMTDDYSESAAVEDYVKLHPDADPETVRADLQRELANAD